MTEAEWLACADPAPMLVYLRGKASERRFGLFACACCCQVGDAVRDERSRAAFFVAERFADGEATREELDEARKVAWEAVSEGQGGGARSQNAARALSYAAAYPPSRYARDAAANAAYAAPSAARDAADEAFRMAVTQWSETTHAAGAALESSARDAALAFTPNQILLIRDIFGNPFRPLPVDPSWLAWGDQTVVRLARGIYDDRAFYRLPILADALLDAGCENAVVLDHCREAGPHVRGCWVVDLLLGRS